MKKFTTTFFLLMAMVLLLPTEMKAVDYYLGTSTGGGWTMASEKFQEVDGKYEIIVTIPDANDFLFCIFKTNSVSWGEAIRPNDNIYGTSGTGFATSGDNVWHPDVYNSFASALKFVYDPTGNTWSLTRLVDLRSKGNGNFGTPTYLESPSNDEKYSGDVTFSTGDECKVIARSVSDNKATNKWYGGAYDALSITGSNITAPGVGTYNVNVDFSGSQKKIVFTAAAPATKFSINYGGTDYESTSNASPYTFKIPQRAFVDGIGLSFTIKDSEGNTYNPSSDTELANGVATPYTTGSASWTCNEKSNASGYTVTLNTKDKTVALAYSTTTVTPPTPVTGKNIYFVGDLFDNQTAIDYNCRYFKMTDNGDNTYSIDLPATLTVKAQLLVVDGENETVYGPNSDGYAISNTWPSGDNGIVKDKPLAEGTKNLTKYWTFADRGLNSDGMYTLTVKLNDEGVPTTWSIKHDLLTRVAYFIAKTEGATVHPAYSKRNNENASGDNKYFGSIYLPANTGCYVISNITKQSDSGNHDLRKTTTKFYLQGNETGGNPITGNSKDTKVFPVQYNGRATIYQPFVFNATEGMQYLLEYNPTQGEDEKAQNYGYVGGEVQVRKGGTLGDLVVKSMKIVGPAIKGDGWDLTANALDMTYNLSENCWEVTFDTTNPAGEYFRFVANDDWKSHWIENGTTDEDKAKIPYDGAGVGQPATVVVPNEVSYTTAERAESNKEYDIIFNRNAGRWTVKFYIETESDQGGNYFKYKFRYTINGYRSVLRTYCMEGNRKPTDKNIKIYGAYAFDNESEKVKLYEMNYIPDKQGVILIGTGVDYVKADPYTPAAGETKYKNIADDKYNNYLVGVLANTTVNASVFDGAGKRTGRNFFFNYLSNTDYYKDGDTDYLGFFRIKSGSTCKANYAYLSLPTTVLTWNGQKLDDVLEDGTSTLSKGIKMVFGIADEDFGSVTGINDIQKEVKADNSYYTLQGIRVNTPSKGIYIHNGRKVVIK